MDEHSTARSQRAQARREKVKRVRIQARLYGTESENGEKLLTNFVWPELMPIKGAMRLFYPDLTMEKPGYQSLCQKLRFKAAKKAEESDIWTIDPDTDDLVRFVGWKGLNLYPCHEVVEHGYVEYLKYRAKHKKKAARKAGDQENLL